MAVQDVMTPNPTVCAADMDVIRAAALMRDNDIGDVLVEEDGAICGVVTDRDIVVRGVADGHDLSTLRLGAICSREMKSLSPDTEIDEAIELMRDHALRRLPVVDGDTAVGIVSLGDLALHRDPDSVLAQVSAAPSNT